MNGRGQSEKFRFPAVHHPIVITQQKENQYELWTQPRRSYRPPRRRRHRESPHQRGARRESEHRHRRVVPRQEHRERVDRTEWHRIVTFQPGLVDMLVKNARKGRLVYVAGKMQTRRWKKDGENSDRFSTEILLVPGSRIQFLDWPGTVNGNGAHAAPEAGAAARVRPCRSVKPPIRT